MHNKVLFIQNFMCMHVYMHVYIRRRLKESLLSLYHLCPEISIQLIRFGSKHSSTEPSS